MSQGIFNWLLIVMDIVGLILIIINYLLAESSKKDKNVGNVARYIEKSIPFECGFASFNNEIPFI